MEAGQKLGRLLSRDKTSKKLDEHLATSCRQFFTQKIEFHPARGPDSHLEHLRARYTPLNKAYLQRTSMEAAILQENAVSSSRKDDDSKADGLPEPKMVLFNSSHLVMGWKESRSVGSGLCNLGNTCFLNSVLQCLTYTPPLYNYIFSGHHSKNCNTQAFCAMCEFQRHCTRVFNSTNGQVKPVPIVKNLRAIARHFHQGRQEDAHEFLRYFIDSLQKCCLQGIPQKLDVHTKATSLVHQIFGGYHRSQVKCLDCTKMSDTFDPLLDISVDIKSSQTLHKALHHYIKPDLLEGDNSYACPFCKKMTRAQKRLTVHRLPNVLTIQLKRFDYNSMFGGKVNKVVNFPEYLNMRPFMSQREGPNEWYRLYGVLVHFGFSCHSGHYYCYVRNSNNVWFCMNDSQVTQVSLSTVLRQEAYLLFYIKDKDYKPPNIPFPPGIKVSTSAHFKVDPNFLKTSAHCTSLDKPDTAVVKPAGLDKTGTPLVKLPMSKPTGVVQPSPHKDTSKETSKGQSLSPPEKSSVAVTSKTKSVSPTNSCGSSGSGGRDTSPLMKEFSIPLRKISSTTPPSKVVSDGTPKKTSSEPVAQQTTPTTSTTAAAASLRFTPRQISAPPKTKKQQKTLTVSSVTTNLESETVSVDERMKGATTATQPTIEVAPSITGQSESSKTEAKEGSTYLDCTTEPKAVPSFKAIQYEEEAPQSFIGPTLPLSAPSPSLAQNPLRISSFCLKTPTSVSPKVALVQPQPQARGKPVARVRPSPHLEENKSEKNSNPREEDQTATTLAPHVSAVSPWKVRESRGSEAFGPALPEGLEYNSSAHGWSVSTIPGVEEDQHHSKAKKHKKKKKHRKHEEDRNESEGERGGKRDRPKKENKSTYKDHYDVSRSLERSHRHRSRSPMERGHHYTPYHAPGRASHHHYGVHEALDRGQYQGRYGRAERHRYWNRDRDTSEYSRRYKHKASHHYHYDRSRPSSRSRSRSPLNTGSEEQQHRERYRTSPHRHTHYHTPSNMGHTPPNMGHTHHRAPIDYEGKTKKEHRSHQHSAHSHHSDKLANVKFDEDRRRERKRSHHHDNDHDGLSDKEHEHKKSKKTTATVPVVEWDSAGKVDSKWDGSRNSSTVEQLTSLSHRSLGENVKSWDGGDNIIDSSKMESEGERKERDPWDAELDKGKLKKVKRVYHGNQFSSGRNAFQEFQNKRNISFTSQMKSDT